MIDVKELAKLLHFIIKEFEYQHNEDDEAEIMKELWEKTFNEVFLNG